MSVMQYLRKFSVIVGTPGNDALDFKEFRVRFTVQRGDYQNPNSADVRVYNLADTTANRVARLLPTPEFTQLVIQAGYEGNYGVIFTGSIKQVRRGRENQKDSYIDITAADGDEAYNFSTTAASLAAGIATPANAIQRFIKDMATRGITQGYLPPLLTNSNVRGRVYYGLTRD